MTFSPGTHLPACVSAAGRVILAHEETEKLDTYFKNIKLKRYTPSTITSKAKLRTELEKIRRQGYARVDGELEIGLYTISAPIFNDDKIPIAALSFGGNVARINDRNIEKNTCLNYSVLRKPLANYCPANIRFFDVNIILRCGLVLDYTEAPGAP